MTYRRSSPNRPAGMPRSIDQLADHRQVGPCTKTSHHRRLGKTGSQSGSLKPAREPTKEVIPSGAFSSGRRRTSPGLPKHYTIDAVAEALDVSSRTVRRWIANGDLIVHRFDGLVRVEDRDLRSFLGLHREG
jgi:excisionase family DNA binding protein